MAIPAPKNIVEEMIENAVNPSASLENEDTDTNTTDSESIKPNQHLHQNINPNRSNDGNSGSPPTDLEKETGKFRGGVTEANSTLMPADQQNKIPDD